MKTIKIKIKNLKNRKSKISYLTVQMVKADIIIVKEKNKVFQKVFNFFI